MEVFSDERPVERGPVNIHTVLEHVKRLAESGFGSHIHFVERYDPSLPAIFANRDQMVQVFLNLVKNACEAIGSSIQRRNCALNRVQAGHPPVSAWKRQTSHFTIGICHSR
jgi:nitrogen-specific signal transduction histidine kinase